jgi:hypothetical protein
VQGKTRAGEGGRRMSRPPDEIRVSEEGIREISLRGARQLFFPVATEIEAQLALERYRRICGLAQAALDGRPVLLDEILGLAAAGERSLPERRTAEGILRINIRRGGAADARRKKRLKHLAIAIVFVALAALCTLAIIR